MEQKLQVSRKLFILKESSLSYDYIIIINDLSVHLERCKHFSNVKHELLLENFLGTPRLLISGNNLRNPYLKDHMRWFRNLKILRRTLYFSSIDAYCILHL